MASLLRMPEVMANATEAVLSRWTLREGESFSVGDTLAEVETEKALVDLFAEEAGVLGRVLVNPGATVEVGTPIAVIVAAGETERDIDAALSDAGAPVGVPAPVSEASAPAVRVAAEEPATPAAAVGYAPGDVRRFASPLARRLAREGGVDLAMIVGTGPGGRVVRRDVERSLPGATPTPVSRPAAANDFSTRSSNEYTGVAHTPMRRAIARRLSESKASVPHFYVAAECVVDELLALRTRINAASPTKVSVNDLVVKAVAVALVKVPEANVTWAEDELRQWRQADVGVAIATAGGLVTPVVRRVDQLRVGEIARVTADLAERARGRQLRQEELEGGSFSVSNLGMHGTLEFSAIINPPQSGIVAVGAARPAPIVVDGELRVATVMRCTLSVDHRAIDGALAARWMNAFQAAIEQPISLLI